MKGYTTGKLFPFFFFLAMLLSLFLLLLLLLLLFFLLLLLFSSNLKIKILFSFTLICIGCKYLSYGNFCIFSSYLRLKLKVLGNTVSLITWLLFSFRLGLVLLLGYLMLVNIYAPNKIHEQEAFFKIESQLDRFDFDPKCKIIIGGDFNIFFDDILDCLGGNPKIKQKSVDIVKDIMLANELTDVWRMRHPGKKRFTWRQPNSTIQRRLDFWLISNSCQEDIYSTDIIPAIKTDHSAITLIFKKVADHKPGPSYWKFNSSLVDDSKYIDFIKSSYPM